MGEAGRHPSTLTDPDLAADIAAARLTHVPGLRPSTLAHPQY